MNLFYPVDKKWPIIQRFGEHPEWYPKRQGHPGVDWELFMRSPLYSVDNGLCKFAGYRESSGYGREVDIQVGNWLFVYGHLSEIHVRAGDKVTRGQVIGISGGDPNDSDKLDGFSKSPHLHFEMRDLTKPQTYPLIGAVDPLPYLAGSVSITPDVPDVVLVKPVEKLDNVTVITDYINIRLQPNTNNPPLGRVTYGMDLKTCGEPVNGFYPVIVWVNDGGGKYLE